MPTKTAVAVGIAGDAVVMLAAIGAGRQMLAPILDPAHRMAATHGEPAEADFFGQQNALVAETAADIRRDHADLALVEAEAAGKSGAHDVRHLAGGINRQLIEAAVPDRDHAATFHRCHALARGADLARDLDRRVERLLDVRCRRRFRGRCCRPSARAAAPSSVSRAASMS